MSSSPTLQYGWTTLSSLKTFSFSVLIGAILKFLYFVNPKTTIKISLSSKSNSLA
jgi:hypothetical protein